jgi:hypothetical protein
MKGTIVNVVMGIGNSLGIEFKPFIPELLPYLMEVLDRDDSPDKAVTVKVGG